MQNDSKNTLCETNTHQIAKSRARQSFTSWHPRKVDIRLPGKGNSNSHGARPVHQIISMIKWIRTSRLSIKHSLSLSWGHLMRETCHVWGIASDESSEVVVQGYLAHKRGTPVLHEVPLQYRGTSLIRTPPPVGPYSSPMLRDLW